MHKQYVYIGKRSSKMVGEVRFDYNVPTPVRIITERELSPVDFKLWDGVIPPIKGKPILIHLRDGIAQVVSSRLFVEYVRRAYPTCPLLVKAPAEYAPLYAHIKDCTLIQSYTSKDEKGLYRRYDLRTNPFARTTQNKANLINKPYGYWWAMCLGMTAPNKPEWELAPWPATEPIHGGPIVVIEYGKDMKSGRTDIAEAIGNALKCEVIRAADDESIGEQLALIQSASWVICCAETPLALVAAACGKRIIEFSDALNASAAYRQQLAGASVLHMDLKIGAEPAKVAAAIVKYISEGAVTVPDMAPTLGDAVAMLPAKPEKGKRKYTRKGKAKDAEWTDPGDKTEAASEEWYLAQSTRPDGEPIAIVSEPDENGKMTHRNLPPEEQFDFGNDLVEAAVEVLESENPDVKVNVEEVEFKDGSE
jgi:hypothetical protein